MSFPISLADSLYEPSWFCAMWPRSWMSGEYGDGDFPLAVSVGDLQIEVVAELVVYSEVEEGVLRNELVKSDYLVV